MKQFAIPQVPDLFGVGYCWMKTLELAVREAGTLNDKQIRDYLRSRKFDLPYRKGVVLGRNGLPSPFSYTLQTIGGRDRLVWPKEAWGLPLAYRVCSY